MKADPGGKLPFFISIPHAGERVPDFCDWLHHLPEEILMCDIDRYVDKLYEPALKQLHIPFVKTEWHRYAADMNRLPADVDAGSVQGNATASGTHRRGFHWQMTTLKQSLMSSPMPLEMHEKLVKLIYEPFHESIRNQYDLFWREGFKKVFHIDAHSMPSVGTSEHKDPGQTRADIVISDSLGKSADPEFVDLVIAAYVRAGFKVNYNWPYIGGRVTEHYGSPARGQNVVQVEISRVLYMDEKTKKILPSHTDVQKKVQTALQFIQERLPKLLA
jgi:N-formylglutamate deformylase